MSSLVNLYDITDIESLRDSLSVDQPNFFFSVPSSVTKAEAAHLLDVSLPTISRLFPGSDTVSFDKIKSVIDDGYIVNNPLDL